mgnify:CR=1 FL=1
MSGGGLYLGGCESRVGSLGRYPLSKALRTSPDDPQTSTAYTRIRQGLCGELLVSTSVGSGLQLTKREVS